MLHVGGKTINGPLESDSSKPPAPTQSPARAGRAARARTTQISGLIERPTAERVFGGFLSIEQIGAAMAVCTNDGHLLAMSPAGRDLFVRAGLPCSPLPLVLPQELWGACQRAGFGGAADWRPSYDSDVCIGFTPYEVGDSHLLLLMREIGTKQQELSARLHQQRLELTGRLVAMIAHDLRVPLSTIVFNAEMARERDLRGQDLALLLRDVRASAARIRASIDGLLDFARPGGSRCTSVELLAALERLRSLLHPSLRDGNHSLRFAVTPESNWVLTNALLLEQVLVNLVMNAVEAARSPITVEIRTAIVESHHAPPAVRSIPSKTLVRMTVQDDGPGVPPELRERVFEPFFTTKEDGTGLGLPMAREAMSTIGGALTLEPSTRGARFALWFSPAEPPEVQEP